MGTGRQSHVRGMWMKNAQNNFIYARCPTTTVRSETQECAALVPGRRGRGRPAGSSRAHVTPRSGRFEQPNDLSTHTTKTSELAYLFTIYSFCLCTVRTTLCSSAPPPVLNHDGSYAHRTTGGRNPYTCLCTSLLGTRTFMWCQTRHSHQRKGSCATATAYSE